MRVQHLGGGGLHPGAFAGGEDDDGRRRGEVTPPPCALVRSCARSRRMAPREAFDGQSPPTVSAGSILSGGSDLRAATGRLAAPTARDRPLADCDPGRSAGPPWCNGSTQAFGALRSLFESGGRSSDAIAVATAPVGDDDGAGYRRGLASYGTVGYGCVVVALSTLGEPRMTPPPPATAPRRDQRRAPRRHAEHSRAVIDPVAEDRRRAGGAARSSSSCRSSPCSPPIPVAWGWVARLARRRDRRRDVRRDRARHHGRLPPLLHPRVVQGQRGRCKIALAIAGSLAIEGPVIRWVADHRKHHKFSDREGDPHSPWRYGETVPALIKGLWYAHMGWLFDAEQTTPRRVRPRPAQGPRHRPDLAAVPGARAAVSLLAPAAARRPADHVVAGRADRVLLGLAGPGRPAAPRHLVDQLDLPRDRRAPVQAAATSPATSGGWRSCRSASPGTTCTTPTRPAPGTACCRGQVDSSARVIWVFEKLGWATDVRWPRASGSPPGALTA